MNTKVLQCAVWAGAVSAAFAVPTVSNVKMSQDSSRLTTITYDLADGPAIVTVQFIADGVVLDDSVTRTAGGDVNRIVRTEKGTVYWQPANEKGWPNHRVTGGKFQVKVTAWDLQAPPDWFVIDLSGSHTSDCDTWSFYTSTNAMPFLLTDDVCKTDRLVMRKIPATNVRWLMGSPTTEYGHHATREAQHYVTLTNDYYMGIYPVTQKQAKNMLPSSGNAKYTDSYFAGEKRPVDNVSYDALRGTRQNGGDWPNDGHNVDASAASGRGSMINNIRSFTGVAWMDLPTSAEWEYACRAGVAGPLYNGLPGLSAAASAGTAYTNVDLIAWSKYWGGVEQTSTHEVGLLQPNAWNLYDMLGNVQEWVLDWSSNVAVTTEQIAPTGPTERYDTNNYRLMRGGAYYHMAQDCRSAKTAEQTAGKNYWSSSAYFMGYRLSCPASFE